MTSKVIEGHKMFSLCLKIYFFQGGTLAHRLSPLLPSPSLSLSIPLYLFSLSCSSPLFLFFTSSPLHRHYIHPMNLYLFSLPHSSSPSIFNLNLRSYGQLFVLVYFKTYWPNYNLDNFCPCFSIIQI